ncbi:MAG: OmpA family protein [Treponema sp.]|nr:OmpA family protein [Treponema sp.]
MKKFFILPAAVLLALPLWGSFLAACKTQSQAIAAPVPPPPPVPEPEPIPVSGPIPEPDKTGPVLLVTLSALYFSPDDDGEDDLLSIFLEARDESGIGNWRFDIREPQTNNLFQTWSAQGGPPGQIDWDGKNPRGEPVQSASDYPYTFTVSDTLGNISTLEGIIPVDVLVIREGNILRIRVPSIIFAPDSGTFEGLDEEVRQNNTRILRRIAQILDKFDTYQVKVEGHANYTTPLNRPQDRLREQDQELRPLSEKRARTVADHLAGLGVNRRRLSPYGIGGDRPVADYTDREGWWKNRRVEFILEK